MYREFVEILEDCQGILGAKEGDNGCPAFQTKLFTASALALLALSDPAFPTPWCRVLRIRPIVFIQPKTSSTRLWIGLWR